MEYYYLFCDQSEDDYYTFPDNFSVQKKIEKLLEEYGAFCSFTVIKGQVLTVDVRPTFSVSVGGQ